MGNLKNIKNILLGKPRNINDPSFLKKITFIPIIAWIGLGADGLSSAAYGPEEAYRALNHFTHLAPLIGLATVVTIFIISKCYANIIQHFPSSGGGYRVVSTTLGPYAGVLSGSALIVDYVLTIPVSIAACGDALFSFAPPDLLYFKLPLEVAIILIITTLNIRGVKETIGFLTPVFIVFITAHLVMIGGGFVTHWRDVPPLAGVIHRQFILDLSIIEPIGILLILFHAYSLGGGTYTGLEAISNTHRHVRDQRFYHIHTVPDRHDPLLCPASKSCPRLAATACAACHRCAPLRFNPGYHRTGKVRRGRLENHTDHPYFDRRQFRSTRPLRENPQGPVRARRGSPLVSPILC